MSKIDQSPTVSPTIEQPDRRSSGCDSTFFVERQQQINEAIVQMRQSYDPRVIGIE